MHACKCRQCVKAAVAEGYNAINPQGWYLEAEGMAVGLCVGFDVGLVVGMYTNDPVNDTDQEKLVLGGQGEMWGETVDASDIEQTIWPRLAAVAEQLWRPQAVTMSPTGVNSAAPRLAAFRCLLNRRGIWAAPTKSATGREAPHRAGSCLNQ